MESYFQPFKSAIARIYQGSLVVGAGFLVSDRHILTCAHVVTAALGLAQATQEMPTGEVEIDFPLSDLGQKRRTRVSFWQAVNSAQIGEDVALLELLELSPTEREPIQLVKSFEFWEHPFRVFGFPKGHDEGVWASGVLREERANRWIQMEGITVPGYAVEPGFSGSPIWDESLNGVVGMAVAAEKRREDVKAAFLIPTAVLVKACPFLEQRAVTSSKHQSLETSSSFRAVKKRALMKHLRVLLNKYEAAYNQSSYTLSQSDKVSLQEQIKAIEQEIIQCESDLENLNY